MEYDFKVILESAGLTTYVIWMISYSTECRNFPVVMPSLSLPQVAQLWHRRSSADVVWCWDCRFGRKLTPL